MKRNEINDHFERTFQNILNKFQVDFGSLQHGIRVLHSSQNEKCENRKGNRKENIDKSYF